ncbi:MAG: DUF692 domain-containing protein [Gammaproteobacteria bacterium]|nr:MAG: DUF692 domain-containing protein [Gammaproteobacteria bacterium]
MPEMTPAGAGIGLRGQHIPEVIQGLPEVPWFEILADNHLAEGGLIPRQLATVRSSYPVTFHCVGMSIAGVDPLDMAYLEKIRKLVENFEPAWISDHLCFTQYGGHQYHDLLPFPYTEQSLQHIGERVMKIQDFLDRPLVIENVSTYVQYRESTMTEAEFLKALSDRTGSGILLDINNAYVNEINHGIDAREFIQSLPADKIREIHLAGYEDRGEYLIDAHNNRVSNAVWDLYSFFVQQCGERPTLIEWDNNIPSFDVLIQEAQYADRIVSSITDLSVLAQEVVR